MPTVRLLPPVITFIPFSLLITVIIIIKLTPPNEGQDLEPLNPDIYVATGNVKQYNWKVVASATKLSIYLSHQLSASWVLSQEK